MLSLLRLTLLLFLELVQFPLYQFPVVFAVRVVGTQLNIAEPVARFIVFFAATIVHQAITIGLGTVLGLQTFGVPYAAIAGEAVANAVVGVAAFQVTELWPGAVERRRMGRSKLRR